MRPPAKIKEWMSLEEMQSWIIEAPDQIAYKKRMAVWLTIIGPFYANEIATMLCVSIDSVWSWIRKYNRSGPAILSGSKRGGRRWSYLTYDEEKRILNTFIEEAEKGGIITVKQMMPKISKIARREISLAYVYKLLKRHKWRKLGPRPHHIKRDIAKQEDFKKNSDNR